MRYRLPVIAGLIVGSVGCAELIGIEPWDSTSSSSAGGASSTTTTSSMMMSSTGSETITVSTSSTSSSSSSSSGTGGAGGGTGIFCGSAEIPTSGYATCWDLDHFTLAVGTYGTLTIALDQPAPSGANDPITPGCVSSQPATNPDTTDPSVYCPIAGAAAGQKAYIAFKSYTGNSGNPPSGFNAYKCDNQDLPTAKCTGTLIVYKDGMVFATFLDPPAPPFSYQDTDQPEPLELIVQL